MENIEKVLEKLKIARKEKGYSHDNMASELGISQASYTNLEKNDEWEDAGAMEAKTCYIWR